MESSRTRYKQIYSFERANDVFPVRFNCWNETYKRWISEGLKISFENAYKESLDYFVGRKNQLEMVKPVGAVPIGLGKNVNPPWVTHVIPSYKEEIIKEEGNHVTKIAYDGAIIRIEKNNEEAMPQYIEHPVKDKKSWELYKIRLDPDSPERIPDGWDTISSDTCDFIPKREQAGRSFEERDFPLGMAVFSVCGSPRDYMGLENFSIAIYDDLDLVLEMMDWQVYFTKTILKKVLDAGITFDFVWMWEDIAYNKGSLFPPFFVKKHMVPRYKDVVEFLHENGIYNILLDCDGNIEELLPIWIECGINGIFPLECASGMDGRTIRKKYGKNVVICGNIDKRALAAGKTAIDNEIEKVKELLKLGGYFPCIDHWIPWDVSLESIKYYFTEIYKLSDFKEYTMSFDKE